MQKYKLVYDLDDYQKEIPIMYEENKYATELEICFIDKVTTVFKNEMEFIENLKSKGLISDVGGSLHIRRPKGKVDALDIIYDDSIFRSVSYKAIQQVKQHNSLRLPTTSEVQSSIGLTIRFFMEDERALKLLNKTFTYREQVRELVNNLNEYLSYNNRTSFEMSEVYQREKYREKIYSQLKSYNLLREVRLWIQDYKLGKKSSYSSSSWTNPYEKYERNKEEQEEKNNKYL